MAEPSGSNYPGALDTTTSLLADQKNLKTWQLLADIDSSVTSISVVGNIDIDAPNYIAIGTEIIHFASKTTNQFTGCTRGADGSVAASHNAGDYIYHVAAANVVNQLKDAIIAVETELGTDPAGTFADVDARLDDAESRLDTLEAGGATVYKSLPVQLVPPGTNVTTGIKYDIKLGPEHNGFEVTDITLRTPSAGTTNSMIISVERYRSSWVEIFSTLPEIDSGTYNDDGNHVVDTSNDDLATDDIIRVTVDQAHSTPAQGLSMNILMEYTP